jgi:hypothetical protein
MEVTWQAPGRPGFSLITWLRPEYDSREGDRPARGYGNPGLHLFWHLLGFPDTQGQQWLLGVNTDTASAHYQGFAGGADWTQCDHGWGHLSSDLTPLMPTVLYPGCWATSLSLGFLLWKMKKLTSKCISALMPLTGSSWGPTRCLALSWVLKTQKRCSEGLHSSAWVW